MTTTTTLAAILFFLSTSSLSMVLGNPLTFDKAIHHRPIPTPEDPGSILEAKLHQRWVREADAHIQEARLSQCAPYVSQRMYHGTTTCSFIFDHGILVAVDSRASLGNYIGTSAAEKVIPVTRHILGTMAGGAADCSFWLRHLSMQARLYEVEHGCPLTVARASKLLQEQLTRNYGGLLSCGTMIMGYDGRAGFSIYYVDNEGTRSKGKLFAVGSGSTYAYSILDANYRSNMTVEEAKTLGLRAIRHATYRDPFSGGYINVFLITKDGWKRLARVDSGYLDFDRINPA